MESVKEDLALAVDARRHSADFSERLKGTHRRDSDGFDGLFLGTLKANARQCVRLIRCALERVHVPNARSTIQNEPRRN
jgi:hypothetical protein